MHDDGRDLHGEGTPLLQHIKLMRTSRSQYPAFSASFTSAVALLLPDPTTHALFFLFDLLVASPPSGLKGSRTSLFLFLPFLAGPSL